MRKLFLMALAISAVMAFGASSAFAAKGGGQGSGKPCPPASPVGQLGTLMGAPSCGNQNPGGGNPGGGGNACPPNSRNPRGTPPNCGQPPVEPPAGNCASAELVVLKQGKIVCVYLSDGELASKDAECPDALIATGEVGDTGIGACVFLPPADTILP